MYNKDSINQKPDNLEDILKDCWLRLIEGVVSSRHPFHFSSIATNNGDFPEIRTVVLRKVIPEERTILFHTDYRSPKINQINSNNRISWLFYDAKSKIQIRIKTISTIHHDDKLSFKSWNDSKLDSKKCYLAQPSPSTLTDFPTDGLPEHINHSCLAEETVAIGYENFSVISNLVTEIDWLFLNHFGHRRAIFTFGENEVEKNWIIP
jgi:3-hydroxyisobutyrate dehydrogenase